VPRSYFFLAFFFFFNLLWLFVTGLCFASRACASSVCVCCPEWRLFSKNNFLILNENNS
jgi:hypothetical protein